MSRTLLCCVVLLGISAATRAHAQEKEEGPLDIGLVGRAILVRDIGGHAAVPRHLVFTPDSKKLISTGDDRTVQVWDVATRERLRIFRLPMGADGLGGLAPFPGVNGDPLVVDRQGEQVALCVLAKGDQAKDRIRWSHMGGYFEKTDGENWVEKPGDYRFVEVSRTDDAVELFDKSRTLTVKLTGNQCLLERKNAEPRLLHDGTWGTLSTFVCSLSTGEAKVLKRVGARCFSPDGKALVIAEGKVVRLVDIATDTVLASAAIAPANTVSNLALSPDGATVALVAPDAKIHLLHTASLKLKKTLPIAGAGNIRRQRDQLSLEGPGNRVVGDGERVVFKTMWSICTWETTFVEGGRVAYHPWGSNLLEVFDSATGNLLQSSRPTRSHIRSWAVSPEPANRYLLLGSADQTLTVYNTAAGNVLLTFFPRDRTGSRGRRRVTLPRRPAPSGSWAGTSTMGRTSSPVFIRRSASAISFGAPTSSSCCWRRAVSRKRSRRPMPRCRRNCGPQATLSSTWRSCCRPAHLQSYVFDTVMAESGNRQHPFLHLPWVVESFPLAAGT